MGTAALREAFNQAGAGKVTASAVRMRYDNSTGQSRQILEFDGTAGDQSFAAVSEPFEGNPMDKARSMADELLKGQPA